MAEPTRFRRVTPTAVSLLFGGPRPANRLRVPLARAEPEEESTMAETLDLTPEQTAVITCALTPRDGEDVITVALDKAATPEVLAAVRLLAGADVAAVARALGVTAPAAAPPADDPVARAAARGVPEPVLAEIRAMVETSKAEIAAARKVADEAQAAARAERDARETAVWLARCERGGDLGHVPGKPAAERAALLQRASSALPKADFDALVTTLAAASAAIGAGPLLRAVGRDEVPVADALTAEGRYEALVARTIGEQKCSRAKAVETVYHSEEGKRLLLEMRREQAA